MTRLAGVCVTLALAIAASLALAGTAELPLKGSLTIRGATIVDPPPEEPTNTHAAFLVSGPAARALFDAIATPAHADECLGEGSVSKSAGNVVCSRRSDGKDYECSFSIDLVRQRIDLGQAC